MSGTSRSTQLPPQGHRQEAFSSPWMQPQVFPQPQRCLLGMVPRKRSSCPCCGDGANHSKVDFAFWQNFLFSCVRAKCSNLKRLPMDQASLKNSDVLILTGLTQIPTANPDGMVGEFCSNLALTVRNGGNVLVPCYPSGVIYDLLECLYQYIDSAGLSNIPFYFISPVANSSLEFSQIFAEWLCHNKQTKVYLPEPPFPHAEEVFYEPECQVEGFEKVIFQSSCSITAAKVLASSVITTLIQTNKLKHYPSIHGDFSNDFRQPCVVFTGHPSLRFGDVVHFMELWGKSSLNTVIFTVYSGFQFFFWTRIPQKPDFSYLEALAPYQPLAMKCIYCPIDTRLNFIQVSKLLKEVQRTGRCSWGKVVEKGSISAQKENPLHVVCPEQYTQPPPAQSHRMDLMIDCQPPAMSYRRAEVLALPFKRRYEKIEIMPELADSLVPMEIKPGISLATVSAVLHTKDNKHVLQRDKREEKLLFLEMGPHIIPSAVHSSESVGVTQGSCGTLFNSAYRALQGVRWVLWGRLKRSRGSPFLYEAWKYKTQLREAFRARGSGQLETDSMLGRRRLSPGAVCLPLVPPPRPAPPTSGKKRKRASDDIPDCQVLKPLLSGSIPVEQFVQTLEKHGFSDIKVEDTAKGHIVLLQEAETLIQIEEDSTHIICDNDEMLRVRLRDLVLKFLQKF
ncbi:hypothetical protein HPG69_006686 [Diceros bicornis minor]|uniref:Beta-Casp domain-containing protein n=1 Tax=Diceros bicornis minor TaxID=77932 RepID=A0A7J7F655_DICBM|nr:hypothetical protein HPG69_006686 [Diceros bicornis minor]